MPRRFFFRLLAAATPAGDHVPDAELLRRFARDRDSVAFELLVRRHADAVWAACRRVLRSEADADDAFQATFLVLARKAGSVRGSCAGGWLYRVAVNAALKLKASSRRAPGVSPGIEMEDIPDLTVGARLEADELAAVVHEELAQLPDRYRLPVVLCDLEGHTRAQAAAVLGWPAGTVAGRLSRAHALLRGRLARRGVTAPAVLIAAVVVPPSVVRDTAAAAAGVVSVPPSVLILVQGVLSAMRTAKLKLAAVFASAGLLGLAGVGTFNALGQPPAPVPPAKGEPPPSPAKEAPFPERPKPKNEEGFTAFPDLDSKNLEDLMLKCPHLLGREDIPILPTDDTLRQLQKARLKAATVALSYHIQLYRAGRVDALNVPEFTTRAVAAAADVYTDPKELRPWLEEWVRVAKLYEMLAGDKVSAGRATMMAVLDARTVRLEAEIALWKATHPKPAGR